MRLVKQKAIVSQQIIEGVLKGGSMTRQQFLEQLMVRPSTLFAIIRRLNQKGILEEPERKSLRTGRKASPMFICREYGFFVGMVLEIAETRGVCIDCRGNVIAKAHREFPAGQDADGARRELLALIADLRGQLGEKWKKIKGIGFADPGLVETERGISLNAVNLPGWKNVDTKRWLEEQTGFPAIVYPSPTARAYAEFLQAGATSPASLFHIQLDAGVGGGFVKNGEMYLGDACCAMEVGHLVVQKDGPLCQCGNRGCLEAIVGLAGLRQRVAELNQNGVHTLLDSKVFSFSHFIDCVQKQDKMACSLAQEIGEYVGVGLASIVTLLNPRVIIFSGELSRLGEPLLSSVRKVLSLQCFPMALSDLQLRVSHLTEEAAAWGAALIVRRRILLSDATAD